ncbi:MAG: ATP-binding protein [Floccifex sp.]
MLWSLNIILNAVTYIIAYYFFDNIYPKRSYHIGIKVIIFIVLIAIQASVSFLEIPILNLVSSVAVVIVINISMFQVKKINFVLYNILFIFCVFISDLLSILAISVAMEKVIEDTIYNEKMLIARYMLNNIFILIFCGIVTAITKRKKHKKLLGYEILVYLLLLSFEIASAAYIANEILTSSSGTFLIGFLIACFLLDLYIIFVFSQLSHSRETELKFALLQQQSQMQMSVYHKLSEKYAQSTKVIHDAKRHFNTIKELISDRNTQSYYDSVMQEFDSLYPQFQCENKILKVLINNAVFRAEHENIRFNMNIEETDISFIADIDLTTIIANLLDNAFDACNLLDKEKRWIRFNLESKMGFVIIHVVNPYTEIITESHNSFRTTKKNHLGIGITNVQNTVEKYDGIFEIDTSDKLFDISITIPQ